MSVHFLRHNLNVKASYSNQLCDINTTMQINMHISHTVFTGLHHQNNAMHETNDVTQNVYFMLSGRSKLLETNGTMTTAILSLLLKIHCH